MRFLEIQYSIHETINYSNKKEIYLGTIIYKEMPLNEQIKKDIKFLIESKELDINIYYIIANIYNKGKNISTLKIKK